MVFSALLNIGVERYSKAKQNMAAKTDWEANEEIKYFQEYLRIPSVHPDPNYGTFRIYHWYIYLISLYFLAFIEPCVAFLKRQAKQLDLPIQVHYPVNEHNPAVILTWQGKEPSLPAILLHSHMDVVPVFPENWTHPPFGAEIDDEGRIFARGTQDMKCVGMQYLGAIRALMRSGAKFKRTIQISFIAGM